MKDIFDHPFHDFRMEQNGLPAILKGWKMAYVIPDYEDFVKCPDVFRYKLEADYRIPPRIPSPLPSPLPITRMYMTDGTFKLCYCEAYETVRQATTEALRRIISKAYDPCEVKIDRIGIVRAYGFTSCDSNMVTGIVLIDDIPAEMKARWLTVERFGQDISSGWVMLLECPVRQVMWINNEAKGRND